jgi:hypothetical protein
MEFRWLENTVYYRAEVFRTNCNATLTDAKNVGWEVLEGQNIQS